MKQFAKNMGQWIVIRVVGGAAFMVVMVAVYFTFSFSFSNLNLF